MVQVMAERMHRFLDRLESRIALWIILGGSSVVGLITGWLSRGVDTIDQFGWFGWWTTGLVGTLLAALILLSLAFMYGAWVKVRAHRKWSEQVVDFNPLDRDLQKKRMKFHDLASPIGRRIKGKRIRDCELIGPANVFLYRNVSMHHNIFEDCIFVVLSPTPDGRLLTGDAVVIEDTRIEDSIVFGSTIMIPSQLVPVFREMGVQFATLTGDPGIDVQSLQDSVTKMQR